MGVLRGLPAGKLPVVPTGLFVPRISNPGLRPGLSSAVPVRQAQGRLCGTLFAIGSHADTSAPEVRFFSIAHSIGWNCTSWPTTHHFLELLAGAVRPLPGPEGPRFADPIVQALYKGDDCDLSRGRRKEGEG
jgi:hypothetical protein